MVRPFQAARAATTQAEVDRLNQRFDTREAELRKILADAPTQQRRSRLRKTQVGSELRSILAARTELREREKNIQQARVKGTTPQEEKELGLHLDARGRAETARKENEILRKSGLTQKEFDSVPAASREKLRQELAAGRLRRTDPNAKPTRRQFSVRIETRKTSAGFQRKLDELEAEKAKKAAPIVKAPEPEDKLAGFEKRIAASQERQEGFFESEGFENVRKTARFLTSTGGTDEPYSSRSFYGKTKENIVFGLLSAPIAIGGAVGMIGEKIAATGEAIFHPETRGNVLPELGRAGVETIKGPLNPTTPEGAANFATAALFALPIAASRIAVARAARAGAETSTAATLGKSLTEGKEVVVNQEGGFVVKETTAIVETGKQPFEVEIRSTERFGTTPNKGLADPSALQAQEIVRSEVGADATAKGVIGSGESGFTISQGGKQVAGGHLKTTLGGVENVGGESFLRVTKGKVEIQGKTKPVEVVEVGFLKEQASVKGPSNEFTVATGRVQVKGAEARTVSEVTVKSVSKTSDKMSFQTDRINTGEPPVFDTVGGKSSVTETMFETLTTEKAFTPTPETPLTPQSQLFESPKTTPVDKAASFTFTSAKRRTQSFQPEPVTEQVATTFKPASTKAQSTGVQTLVSEAVGELAQVQSLKATNKPPLLSGGSVSSNKVKTVTLAAGETVNKQQSRERAKTTPRSISKAIFTPITISTPATIIGARRQPKQDTRQRQTVSTAQAVENIQEVEVQVAQETEQATRTQEETAQRITPRLVPRTVRTPTHTPRPTPPPTQIPIIPFKVSLPRSEREGRSSFLVEVRKRGRFIPIARTKTARTAAFLGAQAVQTTSAASLRIKGANALNFLPKSIFRKSKTETGVVVQRRSKRISSKGEKEEITLKGLFASRMKRRRIL